MNIDKQREIDIKVRKRLVGMKIIDAGIDYIQLDNGEKIYITKKEMTYHY